MHCRAGRKAASIARRRGGGPAFRFGGDSP